MLYFFLLILNIIPNLYAQKNFTTFQVSTIVVNSCENFIDDDYVSLNYDSNGVINNSFLDNIKVKCTKNTNFNLNVDGNESSENTTNFSNNIITISDNSEETQYQELDTNETLIQLNSKIRYLRKVASNKSDKKSFYEVVNVTISF